MVVTVISLIYHLVLPLAWLAVLAARTPRSWLVRALNLLGAGLLVLFLVLAGPGWGVLGWYTRWLLVAVAAPLWLRAAVRARGLPARPSGFGGWLSAAAALVVAALMVLSMVQLAASSSAPFVAEIHSPLPAGTYLVAHGGQNEVLNHHSQVPAQRFALDILALNGAGFRAHGLAPTALDQYVIYGAPLHAPCNGEVLVARDGLEDLPVGLPGKAGRKSPAGNAVLIHCSNDITVVLAHLKPHSVRVAAGEHVEVGRELGQVGNSGNTSEPHLHLHAVRGRVSDPVLAITQAEPVLLRIDGRIPVRNDRLVVADAAPQAQALR